jgi:uncharacterized membrane protein
MTLDASVLAAILAMAAVTYVTRIGGILLATRFSPRGRARAAFDAIPPAVLAAVIAPTVLTTGWPESLAAAVALIAAARLPLLGTVAVGVVAVVILRAFLGCL